MTEDSISPAKPPKTDITVSRGLADWFRVNDASLAFTSYQTGQLFLVGVLPDGGISLNQQNYTRAMGLAFHDGRLYLGSHFQIWRLENMLRPGELGNGSFDAVFVPRNAQTTGDVDVHELGVDNKGRVVFVNTKYSCLARLDLRHSFAPIWQPPFISKLAPEDRCHLNGLAMANGEPKFVSAVSRTDLVNGWRERRDRGGVIIDVTTDRIVADGLSMPHSPRFVDGTLYALDSGRGQLVAIDPATGKKRDIAFAPGFMRGLSIYRGHAIVTLSKPRDGSFKELALERELTKRDGDAWCGVVIINLSNGDIVEWIRMEGDIVELFDVTAIPGVRTPMSVGVNTIEIRNSITFEAK
ncbi:TIGR03032 family protein [Novosphingopyxis sp.]|uniref:TIGR03032 family protein n=1 Tax=Novosphingopyxis sp. TaxID=2709690 RepID=UPI003B599DAB